MVLDEITGDHVQLIEAEGARQLRAAALLADCIPQAQMEPIGLDFFVLNPGERAVVPVKWELKGAEKVTECSTHPEAPVGLVVLPGPCRSDDRMMVVVENESVLPITVTEKDAIAVGAEERSVPSLEACALAQRYQEKFCGTLDWTGPGEERHYKGSS